MIPRTFPSSVASNGSAQMIVYFLPSVSGLTRWVDYIPVQYTTASTSTTENTYNQNGYIPVASLSSISGLTPFKEYVPVYLDSSATDVWKVNITGFIPVGTAGIGGAALYMDFAATTTLDPRVTFSRTTNATLTNSAGLVSYAPHNLLTYSEQFDNAAWVKNGVTVVANATAAPDGTLTADTITSGSANAYIYQVFSSAAATYTFSVWIKSVSAGTLLELNLYTNTGASSVGAAVVTTTGSWQRVSVTGTFASASANAWAAIGGNASFATGETIYVWGAQLELGSTATTYNSTTVKNLLGYTSHFDNAAWTKSNASITSGFTDIYGQPFAQKLVENTATNVHSVNIGATTVVGTPYTVSVYVKAAERSWCVVQIQSAVFAYVNLTTGAVGTTSGAPTVAVASVGNGWYRIAVTSVAVSTALSTVIYAATGDGTVSYTGDGTSGIYIFGAQLSDSASVDPYVYNPVAAPTAQAYYGPRFDYDPVTLAPKGLLIEEQRTNLLTYSEQFDNASWSKGRLGVTANSGAAPDSTQTADLLVPNTVSGTHLITSAAVVTSATSYTVSFYFKASGYTKIGIREDAVTGAAVAVDLASGATLYSLGATAVVSSVGNGWWRVSLTYTAPAASQNYALYMLSPSYTSGAFFALSWVGDGTSGIYTWGAQLEAGAFATSYIPTVASQVTRAADSASMIGNNFSRWYSQSAGTLYAEYADVASSIRTIAAINNGTANESVRLRTSDTDPLFTVTVGGVDQANIDAGTVSSNTPYKFAGAYALNDFAASIAGNAAVTDTSGTLPTANQAMLGNSSAGNYLNGTIKRFAFYSRRLSNSELQGITS